MESNLSKQEGFEIEDLPKSGKSFVSVDVSRIGRAMQKQGKRVHSYTLKKRRFRCEDPINIHFMANNDDVVALLAGDDRVDLSHYDDSLKTGGDGATFFISDQQEVIDEQWKIFEAALGLTPKLRRNPGDNLDHIEYYDLIKEQAERAVQEAIVEINKRRDNPSLVSRIRGFFGGTTRSNDVDIIREYGLVVSHIFVRDFLGLRIPGRSLYAQTQKFYLWIAIMFANLFVNPGGRNTGLNLVSTFISKMYRRQILKSYKNPKTGSILHRLKIIENSEKEAEDGGLPITLRHNDKPFEDYVVNIIMEVAGSFQYLTGSSFGSIIKTIHEKEEGGFGRHKIPDLIKKIHKNPRAWIDEYLRHNSPTGFIFRKAKKPFVLDDTDILPGDMICLITSEAAKDETVFGPSSQLADADSSESFCPYHTHFGGADTAPADGRPTEPHHPCFGQYWARTILQTMLEGLLYFRWLEAPEGAEYQIKKKIFPSYKMIFAKEEKFQQFITILSEIPKGTGLPDEAEKILNSLGHYTGRAYTELGLPSLVHFMSGHVIRGRENLPPKLPLNLRLPFIPKEEPDYLVLELSIDGPLEQFLRNANPRFYDWIGDLYEGAGIIEKKLSRPDMQKRLFDDHVTLVQSMWPSLFRSKSTNGLPFSGTVGLNSARIQAEHAIAAQVTDLIQTEGQDKKTFQGRLHDIRNALKKEMIESASPNPSNAFWVLGGSEAPHFSEAHDDSWVKPSQEPLGILGYLDLAAKLFPRILIIPVLLLFGFLAATFHDPPQPELVQSGQVEFSSARSFAFLIGATLLAGLAGMTIRRFNKPIFNELGEMFLIATFYIGFLICFNSWATRDSAGDVKLWEYPGLGPIPPGMIFPIAIGLSGLIVSLLFYLKFKSTQSDFLVNYAPHSKALGLLIIWLLIGTSLYLHLFWMLPGGLTDKGDYLVSNRFKSASLRDHIFYPAIHAGVITLTIHAYRKTFHNPSCKIFNGFNALLFFGFGGLIWLSALFPIRNASYLFSVVRDISVFTFFIPIVVATVLLTTFRFLNPATASRGNRKSNFIFEIFGWAALASIFINLNTNIRAFWGDLFGLTPLTKNDLADYLPQAVSITKAFIIAFPMTLVLTLIIVLVIQKITLSASEQSNTPHDSDPGIENTKNMMRRENAPNSVQNHMVSVQRLLPEWFRIRVLLPLSFHVIRRMLTTGIIRPGFLGNVGTVHFARWVHLPRTRNYAFLSNYDGSFESYLEDFVTKVNAGLNAAWSHCVGFPKVKNIFVEGTEDGDRFKRWARGSTRPTPFWYSAYPEQTVEIIRRNALIRDGLVRARSASEAEAWFDLFNSTTRPEHALQTDQIQSFIFGGSGHLKSGCCLVVRSKITEFGDISRFKSYLETIEDKITYGQNKPKNHAVYFAISNAGLHNLQIGAKDREKQPWKGDQVLDDVSETEPTWFSSPFILGMDNEERAKVLGDQGDSHRSNWEWGSFEKEWMKELGVLLIYAENDDIRDGVIQDLAQSVDDFGLDFHQIAFKTHEVPKEEGAKTSGEESAAIKQATPKSETVIREPFGFVDGVSNPIIRGTARAAKNSNSMHLVNPGEFILGYRDNRGYFPPSPQVSAFRDIHRLLPALPNQQPQKYPKFGDENSDNLRDLGRNGSYLVIRQLEQDVTKFKESTEREARIILEKLKADAFNDDHKDLQNVETMTAIVQAKIMGRWQDGQTLVTRPAYVNEFFKTSGLENPTHATDPITKKFLHEDNEYLFGRDDPQGYACPFGSHVRRTNPRDSLDPNNPEELEVSNRHRLLRRGRTYKAQGPDGANGPEIEGTFFMCLNADIDRQFEFVQQSWVNDRNFHGLRDEYDPLSANSGEFTIQCPGVNHQISLNNFVTVKGGGYFFMPSKDALLFFIQNKAVSQPKDSVSPFNTSMATVPHV